MTGEEQRRAWTLTQVLKGDRSMAEAAELLGVSERQLWRLRTALVRDGPAGLVHGNRGRASPRRLDDALGERILGLARERYAGFNDSHLGELLAEREGIVISRAQPAPAAAGGGHPEQTPPPATPPPDASRADAG